MPEYTYHPDLMRYAHGKSTLSPWFVRLSQPPMKLLYAAQRSGGAVRVSPGAFTTDKDITELIRTVYSLRAESAARIVE